MTDLTPRPVVVRADTPTPQRTGVSGPPAGSPERRSRHMGWRSRDVIRSAALVMGLYFLLQLLWFANSLFLVVFLGVLFGVAVGAAVDRVERLRIGRFRIRRGVASALIVFGTLGALVGVGALMAPTLGEQFSVLRRQIPAAVDRAEEWINTHRTGFAGMILTGLAGQPAPAATPVAHGPTRGPNTAPNTTPNTAANQAPNTAANQAPNTAPPSAAAPSAAANLKARLGTQLSGAAKFLFPFLSSAAAVAAGLVLIIFLAIYIGAEPQLYHDGLMHLFPHRARERGGQVLTEMAIVLRKWLVTQLIAMVAIGSVTTIVMLLLGVKAAFALGFIAGLLEFIPTVGPILSAIPALAMGFADSPEKAVSVLIAYWGIQFLENNLLIPFLMRGGMDLPPALTLVAQALMTLVFGFLGLMVAVPLTAAAMVPIKMLYVQDVVGDNLEITNGDDDEDDDDP